MDQAGGVVDRDRRQQQQQDQAQGQQGVVQGSGPGLLQPVAPVAATEQVEREAHEQQRQGRGQADQGAEPDLGRLGTGEARRQQQRDQLQHQQHQSHQPQLADRIVELVALHKAIDLVPGVPGSRVGHGRRRLVSLAGNSGACPGRPSSPGTGIIGGANSKKAADLEVVRRFLQEPAGSFFLFGPRGTGKSTWLRQAHGSAYRLDLLDPEAQRLHQARPERLRERVSAEPGIAMVVIDEVQKVPALLDVVHALVEEQPDLRFVLTGSSARKLRRGSWNLLAGRLVSASMHPFLAAELGVDFSLDRALRFGLVPLVWEAIDPEQTLRAYASLYLREEVQAEALVRDLGGFARFLEAISFSHGSTLNLSAVARECQVGRKSVESYLGILEDLLLAFRLPVFSRRAKRQVVAHEKFYYFDAGVFRSLRPAGPLDSPAEIEGMALEGLVAQHLRAWIAYRRSGDQLFYWRTKAGREVDFVVYGPDSFTALEVKRSRQLHSGDLQGLKAFQADYPEARVALLYLGQEPLRIDGILCLPCGTFLQGVDPLQPLPMV